VNNKWLSSPVFTVVWSPELMEDVLKLPFTGNFSAAYERT